MTTYLLQVLISVLLCGLLGFTVGRIIDLY